MARPRHIVRRPAPPNTPVMRQIRHGKPPLLRRGKGGRWGSATATKFARKHSAINGGIGMEPKEYIVVGIDGDYAYLKRTDIELEDELFIARALLPEGTDEGSRLHYEMFAYTLL